MDDKAMSYLTLDVNAMDVYADHAREFCESMVELANGRIRLTFANRDDYDLWVKYSASRGGQFGNVMTIVDHPDE